MKLRTYEDDDREALIALWQRVFPDDPPHNDPSQMIAAKRAVDDLIFVALEEPRRRRDSGDTSIASIEKSGPT